MCDEGYIAFLVNPTTTPLNPPLPTHPLISHTTVTGELFGLEGYQIHETMSVEVSNSDNCYFSIWISFIEIYNEAISDLLAGGTTVKLKEDKHKNFFIDGMFHTKILMSSLFCNHY